MSRSWFAAGAALAVWLLSGCSGCGEDTVVQSQRAGEVEIAVRHRVCRSVAAYTSSVAPPGFDLSGRADDYEPFMITCDCFDAAAPPPVTFSLEPGDVIVVRYDPTNLWEVDKQRTRQGRFTIRYEATVPSPRTAERGSA